MPATDRVLTFSGKRSFTIPAGASAVSDPVDLQAPPRADLAVSVYVPGEVLEVTMHTAALHTTYISGPGDFTAQPGFTSGTTSVSWYWLTSVDVIAPADAASIVAFGDSITDGATSTVDTNRSWPSRLAEPILSETGANIPVLNQGIGGNRILRSSVTGGPNALSRLDRDVLAVAAVKWLMLLEGINDIGQGTVSTLASDGVSADDVIGGLRQIIERAHTHGIVVIGCTLTPFEGARYYSEKGEAIRTAVNTWIRTGGAFDAVVDFDAAVRDPNNPKRFRAGFNNGDNLHPNDTGYKAMADAVDLSIFGLKSVSTAAR